MELSANKSTVGQMKRRRRFSAEEKTAIINETQTAGASVTSVAKKHGVTTGQIFSWRKKILGPSNPINAARTESGSDELGQYQSMLAVIVEQEALAKLATKSLANDVKSGRGAIYNVSCAISNLANATIKLQERRSYLVDRVVALEKVRSLEDEPEIDLVTEKEAEFLCLQIIKQSLEEKRKEAERIQREMQVEAAEAC